MLKSIQPSGLDPERHAAARRIRWSATRPPPRLEVVLKAEFHQAYTIFERCGTKGAGVGNGCACQCVRRRGVLASGAVSGRQAQAAKIVVVERCKRVIQEVESRYPELHVLALVDDEILVHRQVRLEEPGAVDIGQVPPSLRAYRGKGEATAVDELGFFQVASRVAGNDGLKGVITRAKPFVSADGNTDIRCSQGIVHATAEAEVSTSIHNRKVRSALDRSDSGDLPAVEGLSKDGVAVIFLALLVGVRNIERLGRS